MPKTVLGLPQTHWAPLVFQAALSLSVLQKLEHVRDHVQEVHTVTTNVQTQIVNHHTLTEDHEVCQGTLSRHNSTDLYLAQTRRRRLQHYARDWSYRLTGLIMTSLTMFS